MTVSVLSPRKQHRLLMQKSELPHSTIHWSPCSPLYMGTELRVNLPPCRTAGSASRAGLCVHHAALMTGLVRTINPQAWHRLRGATGLGSLSPRGITARLGIEDVESLALQKMGNFLH